MRREIEYNRKEALLKAIINLPSSKSISNRLLIIKYLSGEKQARLRGLSEAADTVLLKKILDSVKIGEKNTFNVGNAGTVMRFLTAVFSVTEGEFYLDCDERMKQRPVGDLVYALNSMGADIVFAEKEGFPPLRINGVENLSSQVEIDASKSSQFVSALMMIGPLLPDGLVINIKGRQVSGPYISMTADLMRKNGIRVEEDFGVIRVEKGKYRLEETTVEADWSSAAFFYEAAALSQRADIFMKGLRSSGLQGDSVLAGLFDYLGVKSYFRSDGVRILKHSGADKNIRVDFTDYPDIAIPYIVACAALGVIGTFTGLENLKIKESNRLKAVEENLSALGYDFRETGFGEWVLINSCRVGETDTNLPSAVDIKTYGDHRIAMAFAPLVFIAGNMTIDDESVVVKSFPGFWNEFDKLLT